MKMLELGEVKQKAARLEADLMEHVLLLGRSQSIGNIHAKYSAGRTTYDWKGTVDCQPRTEAEKEAFPALIAEHTETIYTEPKVVTNWRGIAVQMKWPPVIAKEPVPSVKFELVE
jgi:hypothetical protein